MQDVLKDPGVLENYELLGKLGVFSAFDRLNRRIQDLEELLAEAADIFSKGSLETLAETVTACLVEKFIPAHLVFLLQTNEESEVLVLAYRNMKPISPPIHIESLKPFADFFVSFPNTIGFQLFEYQFGNPEETNKFLPIHPEIVVPIVGPSGLYGLILIGSKVVGGDYSSNELEYVSRLMRFTSIGIQNAIHYRNSVTDPKTALFNNSFFLRRLHEEIAKTDRYGGRLGIMILDLDFFKRLNDTYGHLAGDRVLVEIAHIIRECIREGDVPARFGGEEFTVLLCGAGRFEAFHAAERIRRLIDEREIVFDGNTLSVTVSIGVSTYECESADCSIQELLRRADVALYEAKANGRNRTAVYGGGLLLKAMAMRSLEECDRTR